MRKAALISLLLLGASKLAVGAEPPGLAEARRTYATAVEKATAPLTADYLRKLDEMKGAFTREGKLEMAVVIDSEIKRIRLSAVVRGAIVSAVYGVLGTEQTIDITELLRNFQKAGKTRIILSNFHGDLPKDPAEGQLKQTRIIYSRDGERMEMTYPESSELSLSRD